MQSFQNMKLIMDKFKELLIWDRKYFLESNINQCVLTFICLSRLCIHWSKILASPRDLDFIFPSFYSLALCQLISHWLPDFGIRVYVGHFKHLFLWVWLEFCTLRISGKKKKREKINDNFNARWLWLFYGLMNFSNVSSLTNLDSDTGDKFNVWTRTSWNTIFL